MKFPGYFLIVADFIKWAKAHDIPVGPGRGSGAGSLVAWCADHHRSRSAAVFGLLFERFLNPERVSMPDFDIDFCQDRREEVIRYVQKKYGREQVAQIITFGSLQARACSARCRARSGNALWAGRSHLQAGAQQPRQSNPAQQGH
jgi:DNA polymerase-3 subunit alpha